METTNLHHSDPHAPGALPQADGGSEKLPGSVISSPSAAQGGVGKSTLCVNLALALQHSGRVGLVDADILGPASPACSAYNRSAAGANPGRQDDPGGAARSEVVSMGMLTGDDNPAVLRGPMVGKS